MLSVISQLSVTLPLHCCKITAAYATHTDWVGGSDWMTAAAVPVDKCQSVVQVDQSLLMFVRRLLYHQAVHV